MDTTDGVVVVTTLCVHNPVAGDRMSSREKADTLAHGEIVS
ncbi:hypothetical protein [Nocardiopsis oceani]